MEEWWSFSNAVPQKANHQRMQEQISTRDVALVLVKLFQAFLVKRYMLTDTGTYCLHQASFSACVFLGSCLTVLISSLFLLFFPFFLFCSHLPCRTYIYTDRTVLRCAAQAPAGHGVASASVQPVATCLHGLRRQW